MVNIGTRLLGMSFGRPRRLLGRIGGQLIARGNAAIERHLVELADIKQDNVVLALALGPGPGVGVQAAASYSRQVVAIEPS